MFRLEEVEVGGVDGSDGGVESLESGEEAGSFKRGERGGAGEEAGGGGPGCRVVCFGIGQLDRDLGCAQGIDSFFDRLSMDVPADPGFQGIA